MIVNCMLIYKLFLIWKFCVIKSSTNKWAKLSGETKI